MRHQVKVNVEFSPKDKNEPDPEIKDMTLEQTGWRRPAFMRAIPMS